MATVTHQFTPDQSVYVIDKCNGSLYVTAATVVRVKIQVLVSGTSIKYDIRLDPASTGTKEFNESDIFVDKTTALTEYETRIS